VRDDEDTVEFDDVAAVGETDKALCCLIESETHWVPKSQIHDNSEIYKKGHEGRLVVSRWFAEQKGWV
jgi:hypothetical protein